MFAASLHYIESIGHELVKWLEQCQALGEIIAYLFSVCEIAWRVLPANF